MMFGIGVMNRIAGIDSKETKAANKIGKILHKQIYGALTKNEQLTGAKLRTPFTAGYVKGFIEFGFIQHGLDAKRMVKRNAKWICNGIIPKKLWSICELGADNEALCDVSADYQLNKGYDAGAKDAELASSTDSIGDIKRLHNYLLDEKYDRFSS